MEKKRCCSFLKARCRSGRVVSIQNEARALRKQRRRILDMRKKSKRQWVEYIEIAMLATLVSLLFLMEGIAKEDTAVKSVATSGNDTEKSVSVDESTDMDGK